MHVKIDSKTGEILGQALIDERFGLPPHIVKIKALPNAQAGKVLICTNGKVAAVDDHRGKTAYLPDGSSTLVTTINLPAKLSLQPPPPSLEQQTMAIQSRLMRVSDAKQAGLLEMLLGYKATPAQIERYKRKYERAKNGEFNPKKNSAIIKKHEAMLAQIDHYVDMIEMAREFVADLIEAGELDKAGKIIDTAEKFDHTTTPEQLKELLNAANK